MLKIANFFIPTPQNNYRAYLISNKALAIYCVVLMLGNLIWGNIGLQKAFALFSEAEVFSLHNKERQKQGLNPLSYNTTLAESARAKGQAMLNSDCWSHYCPAGKSPWDFFQDAGYTYSYAGENLAEGFSNVDAMMQAWMNSKTHRENILKPEFTEVGIAIIVGTFQGVKNNVLVVVHFGKPRVNSLISKLSSVTSTQPTTIDGVSLLAPEEGQLLNNTRPNVVGRAQDPLFIDFNEGKVKGSISPEGGIFTYIPDQDLSEGSNSLTLAKETDKNHPIITRNFSIDVTPPRVDPQDLSLVGIINESTGIIYRLQFNSTDHITNLLIDQPASGVQVVKLKEDSYAFDFPEQDLSQGLKFSVADQAGNTTQAIISQSDLENLIADSPQKNFLILPKTGLANNLFDFGKVDMSALFDSPVKVLTSTIVIMLVLLFSLDFILIRRYNQKYTLHLESQSHLHLPTFIILLLLIIMGNFTGKV